MSTELLAEPGRRPTTREIAGFLRDAGMILLGVASAIRGARAATDAWGEGRRRRNARRGGKAVDKDNKDKRARHRPLRRSRRKEREEIKMETITLYRPVGKRERELIAESGDTAFPPRLPEQPIFYPVLNEPYATQIARDWNTKDAFSGYTGYVLRFAVRADYLAHYEVKAVGAADTHQEYWIPAADLPNFNAAIVGPIEVVAEFTGEKPE